MATASERGRSAVAARWAKARRGIVRTPLDGLGYGVRYAHPTIPPPAPPADFAAWFFAAPDEVLGRLGLGGPAWRLAAVRDLPRGCAVCEAPVAKPATRCRAHRRGRVTA